MRNRLSKLNPIPAESVTRQLVDAAVAKKVQVWRNLQEIDKILIECRDRRLPSGAMGWGAALTEWQLRAVKAASEAITSQPREGITLEEIRAIAYRAADSVKEEFLHQQTSAEIVRGVWLSGATSDERDTAKEAVADALAQLPVGATQKQLEQTRDAALAPFKQAIAQREADTQDQALRQNVMAIAWAGFPWDFPAEERQKAIAAARTAMEQLPQGTRRQQLEQTRDRAIAPFLNQHSQRVEQASKRSDAERRLDRVVTASCVYERLRVLENRGEIEFDAGFDQGFTDCWNTAGKVLAKIRPIVLGQILQDPKITDEQIESRAKQLVRKCVDEFCDAA